MQLPHGCRLQQDYDEDYDDSYEAGKIYSAEDAYNYDTAAEAAAATAPDAELVEAVVAEMKLRLQTNTAETVACAETELREAAVASGYDIDTAMAILLSSLATAGADAALANSASSTTAKAANDAYPALAAKPKAAVAKQLAAKSTAGAKQSTNAKSGTSAKAKSSSSGNSGSSAKQSSSTTATATAAATPASAQKVRGIDKSATNSTASSRDVSPSRSTQQQQQQHDDSNGFASSSTAATATLLPAVRESAAMDAAIAEDDEGVPDTIANESITSNTDTSSGKGKPLYFCHILLSASTS
jgi:hypothetical protein